MTTLTKSDKKTHFSKETPEQVKTLLEHYLTERRIGNPTRIRLFYGDSKTGIDWMEENDTMGYVGRSTGTEPIPLLIHNTRSYGGSGILDDCIVKITVNCRTVYQHPEYHQPEMKLVPINVPILQENRHLSWGVWMSNHPELEYCAGFATRPQAEHWIRFMKGETNKK